MKLLKPTGATKVDDDVDEQTPSWDARADQVRRGDRHSW